MTKKLQKILSFSVAFSLVIQLMGVTPLTGALAATREQTNDWFKRTNQANTELDIASPEVEELQTKLDAILQSEANLKEVVNTVRNKLEEKKVASLSGPLSLASLYMLTDKAGGTADFIKKYGVYWNVEMNSEQYEAWFKENRDRYEQVQEDIKGLTNEPYKLAAKQAESQNYQLDYKIPNHIIHDSEVVEINNQIAHVIDGIASREIDEEWKKIVQTEMETGDLSEYLVGDIKWNDIGTKDAIEKELKDKKNKLIEAKTKLNKIEREKLEDIFVLQESESIRNSYTEASQVIDNNIQTVVDLEIKLTDTIQTKQNIKTATDFARTRLEETKKTFVGKAPKFSSLFMLEEAGGLGDFVKCGSYEGIKIDSQKYEGLFAKNKTEYDGLKTAIENLESEIADLKNQDELDEQQQETLTDKRNELNDKQAELEERYGLTYVIPNEIMYKDALVTIDEWKEHLLMNDINNDKWKDKMEVVLGAINIYALSDYFADSDKVTERRQSIETLFEGDITVADLDNEKDVELELDITQEDLKESLNTILGILPRQAASTLIPTLNNGTDFFTELVSAYINIEIVSTESTLIVPFDSKNPQDSTALITAQVTDVDGEPVIGAKVTFSSGNAYFPDNSGGFSTTATQLTVEDPDINRALSGMAQVEYTATDDEKRASQYEEDTVDIYAAATIELEDGTISKPVFAHLELIKKNRNRLKSSPLDPEEEKQKDEQANKKVEELAFTARSNPGNLIFDMTADIFPESNLEGDREAIATIRVQAAYSTQVIGQRDSKTGVPEYIDENGREIRQDQKPAIIPELRMFSQISDGENMAASFRSKNKKDSFRNWTIIDSEERDINEAKGLVERTVSWALNEKIERTLVLNPNIPGVRTIGILAELTSGSLLNAEGFKDTLREQGYPEYKAKANSQSHLAIQSAFNGLIRWFVPAFAQDIPEDAPEEPAPQNEQPLTENENIKDQNDDGEPNWANWDRGQTVQYDEDGEPLPGQDSPNNTFVLISRTLSFLQDNPFPEQVIELKVTADPSSVSDGQVKVHLTGILTGASMEEIRDRTTGLTSKKLGEPQPLKGIAQLLVTSSDNRSGYFESNTVEIPASGQLSAYYYTPDATDPRVLTISILGTAYNEQDKDVGSFNSAVVINHGGEESATEEETSQDARILLGQDSDGKKTLRMFASRANAVPDFTIKPHNIKIYGPLGGYTQELGTKIADLGSLPNTNPNYTPFSTDYNPAGTGEQKDKLGEFKNQFNGWQDDKPLRGEFKDDKSFKNAFNSWQEQEPTPEDFGVIQENRYVVIEAEVSDNQNNPISLGAVRGISKSGGANTKSHLIAGEGVKDEYFYTGGTGQATLDVKLSAGVALFYYAPGWAKVGSEGQLSFSYNGGGSSLLVDGAIKVVSVEEALQNESAQIVINAQQPIYDERGAANIAACWNEKSPEEINACIASERQKILDELGKYWGISNAQQQYEFYKDQAWLLNIKVNSEIKNPTNNQIILNSRPPGTFIEKPTEASSSDRSTFDSQLGTPSNPLPLPEPMSAHPGLGTDFADQFTQRGELTTKLDSDDQVKDLLFLPTKLPTKITVMYYDGANMYMEEKIIGERKDRRSGTDNKEKTLANEVIGADDTYELKLATVTTKKDGDPNDLGDEVPTLPIIDNDQKNPGIKLRVDWSMHILSDADAAHIADQFKDTGKGTFEIYVFIISGKGTLTAGVDAKNTTKNTDSPEEGITLRMQYDGDTQHVYLNTPASDPTSVMLGASMAYRTGLITHEIKTEPPLAIKKTGKGIKKEETYQPGEDTHHEAVFVVPVQMDSNQTEKLKLRINLKKSGTGKNYTVLSGQATFGVSSGEATIEGEKSKTIDIPPSVGRSSTVVEVPISTGHLANDVEVSVRYKIKFSLKADADITLNDVISHNSRLDADEDDRDDGDTEGPGDEDPGDENGEPSDDDSPPEDSEVFDPSIEPEPFGSAVNIDESWSKTKNTIQNSSLLSSSRKESLDKLHRTDIANHLASIIRKEREKNPFNNDPGLKELTIASIRFKLLAKLEAIEGDSHVSEDDKWFFEQVVDFYLRTGSFESIEALGDSGNWGFSQFMEEALRSYEEMGFDPYTGQTNIPQLSPYAPDFEATIANARQTIRNNSLLTLSEKDQLNQYIDVIRDNPAMLAGGTQYISVESMVRRVTEGVASNNPEVRELYGMLNNILLDTILITSLESNSETDKAKAKIWVDKARNGQLSELEKLSTTADWSGSINKQRLQRLIEKLRYNRNRMGLSSDSSGDTSDEEMPLWGGGISGAFDNLFNIFGTHAGTDGVASVNPVINIWNLITNFFSNLFAKN